MNKKIKKTFLLLVLAQGLHSIEEFYGRLWDVFPPAKFLTGMVSQNRESGFLIINISLFIFGLWCWSFPVRKEWTVAHGLLIFWIVIELINGIGHPLWSVSRGMYTPGVTTALLLLFLVVYLAVNLWRHETEKNKGR